MPLHTVAHVRWLNHRKSKKGRNNIPSFDSLTGLSAIDRQVTRSFGPQAAGRQGIGRLTCASEGLIEETQGCVLVLPLWVVTACGPPICILTTKIKKNLPEISLK